MQKDYKIRDYLISIRWSDLVIVNKKKNKWTCWIVDFAILANHRVKLKESEKRDEYLDLAWELKKLWNMKVILIVIGVLGTISKGLVKGLKDLEIKRQVETIQMTAFLRLSRILRKVLESWGDLLSLKIQWKTIS